MNRLAVLLVIALVVGCQTTEIPQRSVAMQERLISSLKTRTVTHCITSSPFNEELEAEMLRLNMTKFTLCRCISHAFYNSLDNEMQNRLLDELPDNLDVQPWRDYILLATIDCLQEPVAS